MRGGEVRWGMVGPNKQILPTFNHFEPHKTTFSILVAFRCANYNKLPRVL